jgi:mannose-1-phosphate guanylyltransferase
MITALIMAGGQGTRFWPLSRTHKPKQFLNLTDDQKTMLQSTVERIKPLVPSERIFIATNKNYKKPIQEQLAEIPEENIILEPLKRNTAPSIGLSSLYIENKYPGSTVLVLPADHLIKDENRFLDIIKKAVMTTATGNNIVTLGIKPTHPEIGYGYIHYGDRFHTIDNDHIFSVKEFKEKPDLATAKDFLKDGNYLWNSGMFIWNVQSILENFKTYMPNLYSSLNQIKKVLGTDLEKKTILEEFKSMENISIDYGIMENAIQVQVMEEVVFPKILEPLSV